MKDLVLDALEDMLDNLRAGRTFLGTASREEFAADLKSVYAVMRALEIVGEAAKRVPPEVRDRLPGVPWRNMAGLRDFIIHQYSRMDTSVLFEIVTVQTTPVLAELVRAIAIIHQEAGGEPS